MSFFRYNETNLDLIIILKVIFTSYTLWENKLDILISMENEDNGAIENEIDRCMKCLNEINIFLDLSNEYSDVLNFYFKINKAINTQNLYYSESAIRNQVLKGLNEITNNFMVEEKNYETAG